MIFFRHPGAKIMLLCNLCFVSAHPTVATTGASLN